MIAEEIGDEITIDKWKKIVRNRQTTLDEFVKKNNLVRRYDKERVITVTDKVKHKAEIIRDIEKDKVEYNDILKVLGEHAPKTLEEHRKI